ncbi:MAG: hypothetical protein IJB83_02615 [Bacilli bacterium]|nr:hypothetical protein [Bacilli bacterium]
MNEDILKEEIAMLESNNRAMQEEMARTWEKYDKVINNWNELKNWLIKKMNEYVTYQGDLSSIYEEVFDKVKEIEEEE